MNKSEGMALTGLSAVLAGTVALAVVMDREPLVNPTEKDYSSINTTDFGYNRRMQDIDGDGDVDVMYWSGSREAILVMPGMVEKAREEGYRVSDSTPRMTEEIQRHATDILNSNRKLEKEIDTYNWENRKRE